MSEFLVARWLAYSATCVVRLLLVPVRLITAALSFSVAWVRLVNASYIPIRLSAPYLPWFNVCCRSWRLALASMKWSWKAVQDFFCCVLHYQKYSGYCTVSATILYVMQTIWVYVTGLLAVVVKSEHSLSLLMRPLSGSSALYMEQSFSSFSYISVAEMQV